MSRFALTAALALSLAGSALAQGTPFEMPRADDPPPGADASPELPDSEGGSLLEGLLNDFVTRAQPHLEGLARDMGGLMAEYSPVLEELGTLMDDIGNYDLPPERLPNGDILIRRKAGAPPPPPLEQLPRFIPEGPSPADPAPVPPAGPQTEL